MTEQKKLGDRSGAEPGKAAILKDEGLAAMVSAYLDDQLKGKELEDFRALLKKEPSLAREIQEMRNIELQLVEMGADILSEPIPEALLEALSRIGDG